MIHQVVSGFSSFSGCLEMCHDSNIPLSDLVKCPNRHTICLIFASLEINARVFAALHLPVAYDNVTRQLANDNDDYKFSACPYSVLQEFAVEIEVMVTSHPEVVREMHVRCTIFSKFLQKAAFITDKLGISWDPGISSALVGMIHLWLQPVFYSSYRHL